MLFHCIVKAGPLLSGHLSNSSLRPIDSISNSTLLRGRAHSVDFPMG